ncbi:hypothetical protein BN7_3961 [Wickerhamomyces ciferrii]|uniref:Uncharacterized protein n=1 Tax=Wickerhamomyces ciferrii (strain ATCC 14091 / BCRC 22168 / CBS 111 / JCM 3599 / NBRC 0793 / NRRL Y-1031 F-60-10) TaxID=1206466 RepID=K0KSU1_WICCF|nr:uncharacterized protein BN7_3961 [Wickerhamomyces ciferrii]CCH44398.1 hypothetical protein BN7_3961 [Wickerhamomyces ciferrii]
MIQTIISSIRSFSIRIGDSFHVLYTERNILEALSVLLGYPRGFGKIYILRSFYNTTYRPFWRLNRLLCPIRYHLSKRLNSLYQWTYHSKLKSLIKKNEDFQDFDVSKIDDIEKPVSNHNGNVNELVLPMEIWEIIAQIGKIDYSIMLNINKSFLNTFAPKIYDTLKLTIVLTPLTKMKLNDEAFLKNGPDLIMDTKYYDSYSIYKRHQESKKFDYEFLDTSIRDQDYFKGIDPKQIKRHHHPTMSESKDRGENVNHPFEVRSLRKIQFILKNILQNPNSIMKSFIKDILVDICIFDGFNKLMTMKQRFSSGYESLKELIDQEIKQNEHVSVMKVNSGQNEFKSISVIPFDDNFDRIRWQDPLLNRKIRNSRMIGSIKTKFKEHTFSHLGYIFPQNIYYKELLSVYLLSDHLYSHILRRRLSKFEKSMYFQNANPIKHWRYTVLNHCYNRITKRVNRPSYYKMIVTGQSCVKIEDREFKTELQVYEILKTLIETLIVKSDNGVGGNSYGLDHVQSSILILGIDDGIPQVSKEFTQNLSHMDNRRNPLLKLTPQLILINKSATTEETI